MTTTEAIAALGALAHEHRLALYRLLVSRGPQGLAAGTIAAKLGVAPSSLTFHLQNLQRSGLVRQRREGRQLIYAADFGVMSTLLGYLTENCCGGTSVCAPSCAPASAPAKARKRKRAA